MLLRRADYLTRPWRNGGGVSHEIAWHGEEDWRLGLAEIVRDVDFSDYTGFDRTLTVAQGHGLSLNDHLLGEAPHGFDGAEAVRARVAAEPLMVVNAITRRGRYRHEVRRLPAAGRIEGVDFIVALSGEVQAGDHRLAPLDTLRLDGTAVELSGAEILAIRFIET